MKCKQCKGTGWVPSTWSPTGYPSKQCKSCDGTGIVASSGTDGAEQEGEEAPSLTGNKEKANQR